MSDSIYDMPEDVKIFDASCDRLHQLLENFCDNQGLPFPLLEGVSAKLRECRLDALTVEEVSPTADALEYRRNFGFTEPDSELDELQVFFGSMRNIMLVKEVREHHLKILKVIKDAKENGLCPKCQGSGQLSPICGWCEDNLPHSSCDDTVQVFCDCPRGDLRRKQDGPEWHGEEPSNN